jgi:type IV pilus assembly protein PilY1
MKTTTQLYLYHHIKPVVVACSMLLSTVAGFAQQIKFSQIPAGNGGREPAPNVIITVDDSGSMGWDIDTDLTTTNVARQKMTLLKTALKSQFGDGTPNSGRVPDGRIRLAFQAMHDNGSFISNNGAKTLTLGATNAMRPFTGAHRVNFNNFIDKLRASNGTPSIKMMQNVFNYMSAPAGTHSPWANEPGKDQSTPYLSCRRTYHIFMTDGAWNGQSDSDRVTGRGDSSRQTLGDGKTIYDPSINGQLRIYKDSFGDGDTNSTRRTSRAHTLSDFAFRNWAVDLQPNIANNVRPLIRKADNEAIWGTPPATPTTPCTEANDCTLMEPFWNPKNNPATWQNITQYTIGFGLGAISWPYISSAGIRRSTTLNSVISTRKTPADWNFNNTLNDTYGGDYVSLVRGKLDWPEVFSWDTSVSTSDINGEVGTSEQDQRTVELWHAALNGRGKYYPAKTAEALSKAFEDILDTVIVDTSTPLVSIATSSSYLRTGLNAYIAGYNASRYSGSLSARAIDATTGAIQADELWDAAAKLDALSASAITNRLVLSYGMVGGSLKGFSWKAESATSINNLPTLHKSAMNNNSVGTLDNRGVDRVNYIRGDRSKEVSQGGIFRDRDSRLGDIVNSNIWYTGKPSSGHVINNYVTFRGTGAGGFGNRTPMVYVGANDGMLHGFSAANGEELLAYIPQAIAQGSLRELTDANNSTTTKPYVHKYYVDGSPFTGDFYHSGLQKWRTYLVGTLAAGGKGYFVLDVTDPTQFSSTNSTVGNLVIMDTTATTDPDIGHIFSPPVIDEAVANMSRQIVQLNNSRWAVVLGNGYNSTNEAPVLLIQYLDVTTVSEPVKITACPDITKCNYKGANGLSSPQLIDINGDGKVDVAYAGDLKGNLWKFDLTSKTDTDWKVAFDGKPFFVAKRGTDAAPITQAITTAPYWLPHPKCGIMLAIATGRNLTDEDRETTHTETIYALYDNSTFKEVQGVIQFDAASVDAKPPTGPINNGASTILPSTLVQQTLSATPLIDNGTSYFTSSNNPVDYDGQPAVEGPPAKEAVPPKRGWYLDFPLAGQRALQNIRNFSGQRIMIQSLIPKIGSNSMEETCSASATTERSFQAVLNMFTGTPPKTPVFSVEDTETFTKETIQKMTMVESAAGDVTLIRSRDKTKLLSSNCPAGQVCGARDFNPGSYSGVRAGFRQLQ